MSSLKQIAFTTSILTLILGHLAIFRCEPTLACAKERGVQILRKDGTVNETRTQAAQLVQKALEHLNMDYDYVQAIGYLRDALDGEDPDAGYLLGMMYEKGMGMNPNLDEGIRYYQRGASLGSSEAKIELALLNIRGRGMPVNYNQASSFLKSAAGHGSTDAEFYLTEMKFNGMTPSIDDTPAVILEFRKLADAGNTHAMTTLGLIYYNGTGTNKEITRGTEYLDRAAKLGNLRALYELSLIQLKHPTINPLNSELRKALVKGANEGNPFAQYMLSYGYQWGHFGLKQNAQKAFRYLDLASRQAFASSRWELGQAYEFGTLIPQNLDEAFMIYESGEEIHNARCMNSLGDCYEYGRGTHRDLAKAREYHDRAIEWGYRPPLVSHSHSTNTYTAPSQYSSAAIAGGSVAAVAATSSSLPGEVVATSSGTQIAKTVATEVAKSAAVTTAKSVGKKVGSVFLSFLGF